MAVTIKDIAAAAGVSRGTVDRALHGRGDVSAEVRERVLRIAEELSYRPNRAALGLAALKKAVRVGLLLPSEGNPFFDEVIRGARAAQESLSDFGAAVVLESVRGYEPKEHLRALRALAGKGVGERKVTVGIRPEHIAFAAAPGTDTVSSKVDVSEMMGSEVYLHVNAVGRDVVLRIPTTDLPAEHRAGIPYGTEINFAFRPELIHLFDPETEKNLMY